MRQRADPVQNAVAIVVVNLSPVSVEIYWDGFVSVFSLIGDLIHGVLVTAVLPSPIISQRAATPAPPPPRAEQTRMRGAGGGGQREKGRGEAGEEGTRIGIHAKLTPLHRAMALARRGNDGHCG